MRKIITVILGIICAGLFLLSLSAIEVTQNRIRQGREETVELTEKKDAVNTENSPSVNKQDNTAAENGKEAETVNSENITEEAEITELSSAESNTSQPDAAQTNTNPAAPVLNLLKEKVEIKMGDKFYPLDYIGEIVDDKSSQQYLYRQIMIDGDYNTEVPGTYTLVYTVADEDGNVSSGKKLHLIVK